MVHLAQDENFGNYLSQHSLVVVKYSAEWCGSCILLQPFYERLSDDQRFEPLFFVEVDAEHNIKSRKLGEVDHLPFFSLFREGQLIARISTDREVELLDWMIKVR